MIIDRTCVLVTTPLGIEGKGGIDRLMRNLHSSLCEHSEGGWSVFFVTTRGERSLAWSLVLVLSCFVRIAFYRLCYKRIVVHLNVASRGSTYRKMLLSFFCRLVRVPYVIHLHGSGYDQFFLSSSKLVRFAIKNFFRQASSVVVLGKMWSQFVISEISASPDRVVVIRNATEDFTPPNRPRSRLSVRVIFLGEIGDRKGAFDLLCALDAIRDIGSWSAVIAGNGRVTELNNRVRELRLEDRISVPGWLAADASRQLLLDADILVLPSYAENLPMAIIEAMAAGLPVVTTPVGATAEIVDDGETGFLVQPGDVKAISEKLRILISDKELRVRFGSNGRKRYERALSLESFRKALFHQWSLAQSSR